MYAANAMLQVNDIVKYDHAVRLVGSLYLSDEGHPQAAGQPISRIVFCSRSRILAEWLTLGWNPLRE